MNSFSSLDSLPVVSGPLLPCTRLVYLDDTYLFEGEANLIGKGSNAKGSFLVFDQTVFYPQGGGQPSDLGTIDFDLFSCKVVFVGFDDGRVLHYIDKNPEGLKEGSSAIMKVDQERRILNASSHTCGHLLDSIVQRIAPELIGQKGYHFPNGPYVEFEGVLSSLDQSTFLRTVNEAVQSTIQDRLDVQAFSATSESLKDLKLPTCFKIPDGKELRMVRIGDFPPVPCGGTHIQNLSELREVSIRKIAKKGTTTKISYSFFPSLKLGLLQSSPRL